MAHLSAEESAEAPAAIAKFSEKKFSHQQYTAAILGKVVFRAGKKPVAPTGPLHLTFERLDAKQPTVQVEVPDGEGFLLQAVPGTWRFRQILRAGRLPVPDRPTVRRAGGTGRLPRVGRGLPGQREPPGLHLPVPSRHLGDLGHLRQESGVRQADRRLRACAARLWSYSSEGAAIRFLDEWVKSLRWQRLPAFQKLALTLLNPLQGLLAYCKHKVPFGVVEAINGNLRSLIRLGRGYQDTST